MKKVYCSYCKCGNRRVHFEKPDIARGPVLFEVPDDVEGPWFCSIECMSYAGKDYKTIAKHMPNVVGIDKQQYKITTFNTVEELLEIDWVKSWSEYPRFTQYSLWQGYLMSEWYETSLDLNTGFDTTTHKWWAVGLLSSTEGLNLPRRDAKP